ncbi:hypothetical protein ACJJTC_017600 [Scirpophaga incertulas]
MYQQRNILITHSQNFPRYLRSLQNIRSDFDDGWRQKQTINISPIFPRILDNITSQNTYIPVDYIEPSMFEDYILEMKEKENNQNNRFLDVTIKDLIFHHHYLFSMEKMLSVKLVKIYNSYINICNIISELSRDIIVCRETIASVKQEFEKISPNKKDNIRFEPTIRKYTAKLLETKKQYIDLLIKQKETIHNIVSLWSDIEMVREKSGCIRTPYNLDIVTQNLDDQKFTELWNETYNAEFNDLLDKVEYEYVSKYLEYKESKQENKKLVKPKIHIDEETLKEETKKAVARIISRDHLKVILKVEHNILSVEPNLDKEVLNLRYYFEIYVDDIFVCRSDTFSHKLGSLFEIKFIELITIQILPRNKMITINMAENDNVVSSFTVDLLELNNTEQFVEFSKHNFIYKNIVIHPTQNYVGHGYTIKDIAKANRVRIKSSNLFNTHLETICEVYLKMNWNEKLGKHKNEPIKDSIQLGNLIKRLRHGVIKPNNDIMVSLISKIYGKDVTENANLVEFLLRVTRARIHFDVEFSMNENNPDYIRLKLLHLRNNSGFASIVNKMVPLHASQISTEQLNALQIGNEGEMEVENLHNKHSEMNLIDLQRYVGCKYVQKLNRNMAKNLHEYLLKKTYKDVVLNNMQLSWRSIFSRQPYTFTMPMRTKQRYIQESLVNEQEIQVTVFRAFNLLDRSTKFLSEDDGDDDSTIAGFKVRPLRPYVQLSYHGENTRTSTAIGCHPTWNQTLRIKINLHPLSVLHINLFDEQKTYINEDYSDDGMSQGKTVHYRCSSKWIGALQVPLSSVIALGSLHGTFKIRTPPVVFGYDVLLNKDTTRSLIPEVTQLLKKEASFVALRVTTSLSHLGGLHNYDQPVSSSADDDDLIKHLNKTVTQYTNDFPTRHINLTCIDSSGRNKSLTQFLQPIPLPDFEYFPKNPKNRSESAVSKSSGVSKSSSSKSSGGRRKESDIEASHAAEKESVYSGFEGSWRGEREESQMVKLINVCLRYVSLIPTYEVTESHVVTLMGVELLKVLYGSPLDHSILLASYFLYLGIKCWVIMGNGLPRGRSSYVLTKYDQTLRRDVLMTDQMLKSRGLFNKNDGFFWNVYDGTTGERFDLRDVSCPLKSVDLIFDNENIWLNMQLSQECENVSFDLSKLSNWMPVFDKAIFTVCQPPAQVASIYGAPADVAPLREMLEAKIKAKVQRWRPNLKTIWNRYCSSLLREMLPNWEYWTFNPSEPKPGFSQRLKQLMITYQLSGFPLNMSYANAKSVVAAVKSTGLHVNDDSNVEYGLAVELYTYPNNVLSVWIFFASITRMKF